MSGPSFGLFISLCLNRGTLYQVNFVLNYIVGEFATHLRESPWRVASEKQSLKWYSATISKYIKLFFYVV